MFFYLFPKLLLATLCPMAMAPLNYTKLVTAISIVYKYINVILVMHKHIYNIVSVSPSSSSSSTTKHHIE